MALCHHRGRSDRPGRGGRRCTCRGVRDFSCTIPHKVAVVEYLDGLGESASVLQAVNCVVHRDGNLTGENTDGKGLVESIRKLHDPVARLRGCETLDGLEMLVGQGVIGVEYWTGRTADAAVMRQALDEVFSAG